MIEFISAMLIISVVVGMINGYVEMREVRKNPCLGIKPSKNLISFLFLDKR